MTPLTKGIYSVVVNGLLLGLSLGIDQIITGLTTALPAAWWTPIVFLGLKALQQWLARRASTGGEVPQTRTTG